MPILVQEEPASYTIKNSSGGSNIVSEQFTFYDMSPDELSSKGSGGQRQMYDYVPVQGNVMIETPPDTYKPDKISNEITIDKIQQQRNSDVPMRNSAPHIPIPDNGYVNINKNNKIIK